MAVKHTTLPILPEKDRKRFWSHVEIKGPDECWPWTKGRDQDGYGKFSYKHTNYRAHRFAYELGTGKSLGENLGCHNCDNPPCCNWHHIRPDSELGNNQERVRKGRGAKNPGPIKPKHGTELPQSRFSDDDIRAIRAEPKSWGVLQRLAKRFNSYPNTMLDIRNYKTWKHIK